VFVEVFLERIVGKMELGDVAFQARAMEILLTLAGDLRY
jgi:hypothetical protein